MKPHIITIEVSGGNVTGVENIPPGCAVRIVDYDNIKAGDPHPPEDEYDFINYTLPLVAKILVVKGVDQIIEHLIGKRIAPPGQPRRITRRRTKRKENT